MSGEVLAALEDASRDATRARRTGLDMDTAVGLLCDAIDSLASAIRELDADVRALREYVQRVERATKPVFLGGQP